jgi:beta-N-acetylhexosaminidase
MGKVIASTTMTVDGPADVGEWYVSKGDHDLAAREQFQHREAMLLEQDLVDELSFWVHPAVWGAGTRPYKGAQLRMRRLDSRWYDSGVALLRNETVANG